MHIKPTTDWAVLLMAVADTKGILRFPTNEAEQPGLLFALDRQLPVDAQLMDKVVSVLKLDRQQITIDQKYADSVLTQKGFAATLYAAKYEQPSGDFSHFPTWAELVRSLPSDKNRVPYLRAMQVYSGARDDTIKVQADGLDELE